MRKILEGLTQRILSEPVAFFGALAAVIPILISLDLIDSETGGAIATALIAIGAWLARRKVTPNKKVINLVEHTSQKAVSEVYHAADQLTKTTNEVVRRVVNKNLKKAGLKPREIG